MLHFDFPFSSSILFVELLSLAHDFYPPIKILVSKLEALQPIAFYLTQMSETGCESIKKLLFGTNVNKLHCLSFTHINTQHKEVFDSFYAVGEVDILLL